MFPSVCSLCGQELAEAGGAGICRNCWESLGAWVGPACPRCGLPLPSLDSSDRNATLCGQCREERFEFDWARSFGPYTGKLRSAILQLKFHRRERLGKRLGELLAGLWRTVEETGLAERPVLVPVPLHPSRQRVRGYNQAELLAGGLSGRLAKVTPGAAPHVETRCLRRTRATVPQTGLSPAARQENVRGVFEVTLPERLSGRVVVLVDDVMTTGATLSACARAFKRAGVPRVLALTLARATPQFPDNLAAGAGVPVDELGRACP